MLKNVGNSDRIIRALMGMAMLAAFFMAPLDMIWRIVLAAGGVIMLGTSMLGFCPIYQMLGMSSCKVPKP